MKPANLILLGTLLLLLLSGGCALHLSSYDALTPQQTRIFETCNTTWNMGVGAIFGLLGSKAADLRNKADDTEIGKSQK